jgi:hypothetical protein
MVPRLHRRVAHHRHLGQDGPVPPKPPSPQDVDLIQSKLVRAFRAAGVSGRIEHDPADPLNAQLIADTGAVYGLANGTMACLGTPRWRWAARARAHVAAILDEPTGPIDLRDPEFRYAMRARLFPEGSLPAFVSYARPVAPGLVEAICVDLPRTVLVLNDDVVASHDLDALFSMARTQLQFESEPERSEIGHGVIALSGDSLFVASQVLNPRFVAAQRMSAPAGFAFLAPHRHQLLVAPVRGPESVSSVNALAHVSTSVDPATAPGGLLSTAVYFAGATGIQCISDVDERGELRLFLEALAIDP